MLERQICSWAFFVRYHPFVAIAATKISRVVDVPKRFVNLFVFTCRKYARHVYVLTDAVTPVQDAAQLQDIVSMYVDPGVDCHLHFVGFGTMGDIKEEVDTFAVVCRCIVVPWPCYDRRLAPSRRRGGMDLSHGIGLQYSSLWRTVHPCCGWKRQEARCSGCEEPGCLICHAEEKQRFLKRAKNAHTVAVVPLPRFRYTPSSACSARNIWLMVLLPSLVVPACHSNTRYAPGKRSDQAENSRSSAVSL